MLRTNGWSQAMFGGLLWGDRPVRYIFMDEAGTSAHEPVTVVVGLVANADTHVMAAEALAHEVLGSVPPDLKPGFVFRAMQVFGDKSYRDTWSLMDRLHLLKSMMSIPSRIGMGICVSAYWRNSIDVGQAAKELGLKPYQFEHFMAFSGCIGVIDRNIRDHAGPNEVGTVVAENIPEMRKFLKWVPRMLREDPRYTSPKHMRQTISDQEAGYSLQRGELRVTRIRNSVHFVEKSDDPLVQVADACAYGLRRYFANQTHGQDFAKAILGDASHLRNFAHPSGTEYYWPLYG